MHPLIMVAISVVLGVSGQLLFKYAMMRVGTVEISHLAQGLIPMARTPFVWLGLLCYGLSTIMWLVVLSRVQLSLAYPLVSTGYILILALSYLLFKEPVTWLRFAGVVVIVAGVIMVTNS